MKPILKQEIFFPHDIKKYLVENNYLTEDKLQRIEEQRKSVYTGFSTKKELFFVVAAFDLEFISKEQLKAILNNYFLIDILIDEKEIENLVPDYTLFSQELCKSRYFFQASGKSNPKVIVAPLNKRQIESIVKGVVNSYTFVYALKHLIKEKNESL